MLDSKHILPENNERGADRRERQQLIALLMLFVVLSIIIGALYLAQATTNVSNTRDIEALRKQRDRLERDNEILRARNAELTGLEHLMEHAATLGFVTAGPENIQYIVVDGYVYNQPAPTSTAIRITPTPQIYEDNFSGWLRRQLVALKEQFRSWGQD